MIKVYVRAIVPAEEHYLLMGEKDSEGKEVWDLPGGPLVAGVDVKQHLTQLVLQSTGYVITGLRFFEIVCRVRPRRRDSDAFTAIEFVFSSRVESAATQPPTVPIERLPYANFEWLASDGRFRQDKVMALIGKFHRSQMTLEDGHLEIETEAAS